MNFGGSFSESDEATGRTPFSSSSSYSPSPLMNASSSHRREARNDDEELVPRAATAEEVAAVEKEHMFDKVVTPSDVGKLNRLVIPKQHAEKFFPLDASSNENGLLLNFEDRTGKPWRFRYSYWNSSQSYVMTKGWSRFVKEKKLDAGDVVSFQRGLGESGKDRLYIDWRRRTDPPNPNHHHALNHNYHYGNYGVPPPPPPQPHHYSFHYPRSGLPWSPPLMRPPGSSSSLASPEHHYYSMNVHPYRNNTGYISSGGGGYGYGNVNPVYYNTRSGGGGVGGGGVFALHEQERMESSLHHQVGPSHQMGRVNVIEPAMVLESVPVVHGKVAVAGKRLRLFGVNMDCAEASDHHESDECVEILSASTTATSATTSTTLSQSKSQSQLELMLYNIGTSGATADIFNRGKTNSSPSTSMSLDFDLSEQ